VQRPGALLVRPEKSSSDWQPVQRAQTRLPGLWLPLRDFSQSIPAYIRVGKHMQALAQVPVRVGCGNEAALAVAPNPTA